MWSIAVEFQFYLISPFIVESMLQNKRPWAWPLILSVISTVLNFTFVWTISHEAPFNAEILRSATSEKGNEYWEMVYEKMYTRMTPYLTGMYAAYVHHTDDGSFFEN